VIASTDSSGLARARKIAAASSMPGSASIMTLFHVMIGLMMVISVAVIISWPNGADFPPEFLYERVKCPPSS
jgi:hypothetical protein